MIFNNRENECVDLSDGRTVWLSRSPAVVACIIGFDGNNVPHALMVQRGEKAADYRGFWCLPCGYLDWDETGTQAVYREVWEETGINLDDDIINVANWCDMSLVQPFYVNTDPKENRQNISLSYGMSFKMDKLPVTTLGSIEGECQSTGWIPLDVLHLMPICFSHDKRIEYYMRKKGY
jgi:ADP-ribose pyrophosphatase YjhB (NUDIX family)